MDITIRSVRFFLDAADAISDDDQMIMRAASQFGAYTSLTSLASPFEGPYYVKNRWGWYVDGDDQLQQRLGVQLLPLAGGAVTVYSCTSGTVDSVSADSITIAGSSGTIRYGQLISVGASLGQTLSAGTPIGTVARDQGLELRYSQDGVYVNPVFYLPQARTTGTSADLVAVALSQIGNVGGEPYWSWYGFSSHVEWCACFVSWCANECGYIEAGVIPKFAGCTTGSAWFRTQGLWQDRNYIPQPGNLIFFNWDNDEWVDHVGIVEMVENGYVYTIEGNSGDACRENRYPVGYYQIYGYGTPAY